ncbi:MAG: PKD domain-containing protein [Syntrophobacteraceae bacterium]
MCRFPIPGKKNPLKLSGIFAVFALALALVPLTTEAYSAQVTVAWTPGTGPIAGYNVYYGVSTGQYTNSLDAGNNLSCTLQNLSNSTCYIAAADYDAYHNESSLSPELVVQPLTASAATGGTITPSGTFFVMQGANQTFTITPNVNCHIADVQVDGQSVGPVSSYTVPAVSAPHSITAIFAVNANCFTITASADANGSISPYGQVAVVSGTTLAYKIMPAANYKILRVKVDGRSVGAVSRYTFRHVRRNHTIAASFAPRRRGKPATLGVSGSLSIFAAISPPIVDAGPDQVVQSGSEVTLNGSNSADTVSGIASYKWTQASGPQVKLLSPSAPICTFTAPSTANGELLAFNLEITNNGGAVTSASCLVNVSASGQAPLANPGAGQTVQPYTNVTLDGSGSSDADGGIASYAWVQIEGPLVAILNANTSHASFVAPDPGTLGASLVFQLQVTDYFGLTTRDQCTVNVVNADPPPVANAGPDQIAVTGSSVTLVGSGSYDPVNSTDSYRWKQIRGAPVTLSNPAAITPVFTAPQGSDAQNADLLFMLTVTDANDRLSATAKCVVTVKPVKQ